MYLLSRQVLCYDCGWACKPHLSEVSCHYGVVVKCFASGQWGLIPGRCRSWSLRLQSSKVVTPKWYSQFTCSVWVWAAALPLCTILLLHTPLKHLTHEQPAQSTTQQPRCLGGLACTPHLWEVSHHYGVVVKCFASGQCGPGLIPGRCRSWSRRLQSSKVLNSDFTLDVDLFPLLLLNCKIIVFRYQSFYLFSHTCFCYHVLIVVNIGSC